jgi:hypothetical protein
MFGLVEAPDQETAIAVAIEAFDVPPADRRRIIIQRTSDHA